MNSTMKEDIPSEGQDGRNQDGQDPAQLVRLGSEQFQHGQVGVTGPPDDVTQLLQDRPPQPEVRVDH